jgi:phage/plasmid-like protein (TIGR03299 family)
MTRRAPWTIVGNNNEYNVSTAAELITAADLDWRVNLSEVQTVEGLDIKNRFATVKTQSNGDQSVLAVVGSRYQVIQNAEIFSCLDDVVGTGQARYAAAGELGGGKVVWTVLELPEDVSVGNDEHTGYIVARTSHDGSTPFQMTPIMQRLACTNGINLSMLHGKKNDKYYSIRHTENYQLNTNDIRLALDLVRKDMSAYVEMSNVLSSLRFDDNQFISFAKALFPLPAKIEFASDVLLSASEKRAKTAALRKRTNAFTVWTGDTGTQENLYATKFGAFQAIVETVDHFSNNNNKQAERALLGTDTAIKHRALQLLGV